MLWITFSVMVLVGLGLLVALAVILGSGAIRNRREAESTDRDPEVH